MKVAVTTSSFAQFSDEPVRLLTGAGLEVAHNPYGRVLTEDEAVMVLSGCAGVCAGTEPLTAAVFDRLPGLKVISRCGTGMDNVDLAEAQKRGIAVRNTPDAPTRPVAELVLGLALDLLRHISAMDRTMRQGEWKKQTGRLLQGKVLGIIGLGRIGRAVAEMFRFMGCEILYYDPFVPECSGCTPLPLNDLLVRADIVTLHCPKTADGKPLIGDEEIRAMKDGAYLINAARGGLVDEASLYSALNTKKLAGAAVDVFVKEPYTGPLLELSNVLLTPHIGSAAKEARIRMEVDAVNNLLQALGAVPK